MMRKKSIIISAIAILAVSAGVIVWWQSNNISSRLHEAKRVAEEVIAHELQREVSAPDPLRNITKPFAAKNTLTRAGTIRETNAQRSANKLPPLSENTKLNEAATVKLKDMFARQYFAHSSPQGVDAAKLAGNEEYEYARIGENLALGNFENDKVLVQAWMDSPGHKANILQPKYQEIGVAVGKGTFEGEETWLAVQIFGTPSTACPLPEEPLKERVELNKRELERVQGGIDDLRNQIEQLRRSRSPEVNQVVAQYNNLVNQYNMLVDQTKTLVAEYNEQVRVSNECIED